MNLLVVWQDLSLQKKLTLIVAMIATVAAMSMLGRQVSRPQLALLFAGLDTAAAGEVVMTLDKRQIPYEVRGEAIYVPVGRRDSLRLELAAEGLPAQTSGGYELLDTLDNFATTSELFSATYWRAKEGEIGRTIMSIPGVRAARVHIGASTKGSFGRQTDARSASVTLTTNAPLTRQQAQSIQYLTGLAVAGLSFKEVAVIDTSFGVLTGPGMSGSGPLSSESDVAEMEQKIKTMLEARVGEGNAMVTISYDLSHQREAISERHFDPEASVLKSKIVSERTEESQGSSGAVTVASNLPEGEAGNSDSSSGREETQETTQYEISETNRQIEVLPGKIERMSIAVLLNNPLEANAEGIMMPIERPEEEVSILKQLVIDASGFRDTRGDAITIRSMTFISPPALEEVAPLGFVDLFMKNYLWTSIKAVFLAVVALILGLFVVRPLLAPAGEAPAIAELNGETVPAATLVDQRPTDPVEMLKELAQEQPDDAATLLMTWLDDETEVA